MIRSDDEVRSLWHELRTAINDEYGYDIGTFHDDWKALVQEVLRTDPRKKSKVMVHAEFCVTICLGLVGAVASEAKSLFRIPQIKVWIDEARETGRIPDGIDGPAALVLSRYGYTMLRISGVK